MMIKSVIFDAFGTLLQIKEGRHPYRQLMRIGREQGRRPKLTDSLTLMQSALGLSEMADHLGIYLSAAQGEMLERILGEEIEAIEAYSDGYTSVERLQEAGFRVGVCSNLAHPYHLAVIRHFPSLDGYSFSSVVGVAKPNPEIYRHACLALGSTFAEACMIGDSFHHDKDGPSQIGVTGHLLDRTGQIGDYTTLTGFADHLISLQ